MKNKLLFIIASFVMLATDCSAQDSWAQKANFAGGARISSFCFSIGSKGYVGTGLNDAGIYKSDFWEYDPDTDIWTQKADFGGGIRAYATGFTVGNKGYAGTGVVGSYNWRKDMWQYDAVLNTWTQIADFGGGLRYTAVGFGIGNKGYMGTGNYRVSPWYNATYYDDFWEYDPSTDIWTKKANLPEQGRCSALGLSIGSKGYIGFGYYYYDTRLKDLWEYDPNVDTWTRKANFEGNQRVGAVAFTIGNKGYIGTGWDYSGFNDIWEFNPSTDIWIQKASLPGPVRYVAVAFNIANKGYIGLGGANVAYNDFYEYSPPAHPEPVIAFDPIYVSTYAGSGEAGFADGTSLTATFNNPMGVAADAFGNVYVADAGNNRIRKITQAAVVSTFAGNGVAGFADGNGTNAQFSYPHGVAVDPSGNVFVADENNNRIRKITPAGMVSTLAGSGVQGFADGEGVLAQFNHPKALTIDISGNVYVADYGNNRIRKITAAGYVSTFAGDGTERCLDGIGTSAQLFTPDGVAVDSYGNLFATLFYCGGLRKINTGGVVSRISTDPQGLYNTFHTGVAVDALNSVYISIDNNGHQSMIFKMAASGQGAIFAGTSKGYKDGMGTEAKFEYPAGLSFDAAGNLLVADPANNRIRKITPPVLNFSSYAGTVSASQFFSISGTNLTGDISLTAPAGYEISISESNGYSTSLVIPALTGEVNTDTIYIRLSASAAAGTYNGNISMSADAALTKMLPVIGKVTDTIAPITQCPPAQIFCFDAVNYYTVPAITATDISGIKSIEYTISGATARTGTGANASGIFYPGLNSIVWTVKDNAENTSTCSTTVRINMPLNLTVPDAYPLLIWGDANTIYKGFGPTCATLIALPSGGTKLPGHRYNYQWSTGANTPIISVCPKEAGNHTYTLTVTDSLGCTVSVTKTIKVIDVRCGTNMNKVLVCRQGNTQACLTNGQAALALLFGARLGSCGSIPFAARSASASKETMVENDNEIKVFPNPTTGVFTVQLGNTDAREIKLVDMNGKMIYRKILNGINKSPSIQINPGKIANGIYLVQVLTNKELFSSTIIVQQ